MTSYCDFARDNPVHSYYHDNEYGFLATEEAILFERLTLEIMQAGLNWGLILKKRPGFRAAFAEYSIDRVMNFGEEDIARLLADEKIVRNRLKINAIIHNAGIIHQMRASHGNGTAQGFHLWLKAHHPLEKSQWVKLFKKTFKFTGGEITGEFLMSLGYLPGTHIPECPIYDKIAGLNPPWMQEN